YPESFSFPKHLTQLNNPPFYPPPFIYHYLNIPNPNQTPHLPPDHLPINNYFYLLPPLLPSQSIQPYPTLPPIHFHQFLKHLLEQAPLLPQI
ncbi:DNA polymerase beta superfamily protein, partial [Bacillus pumilus]|uniref:DNA polymerase beta superfamily protein n=1 Tax=Bacillus pumilus TaxID=1408 RepID=UPI0016430B11